MQRKSPRLGAPASAAAARRIPATSDVSNATMVAQFDAVDLDAPRSRSASSRRLAALAAAIVATAAGRPWKDGRHSTRGLDERGPSTRRRRRSARHGPLARSARWRRRSRAAVIGRFLAAYRRIAARRRHIERPARAAKTCAHGACGRWKLQWFQYSTRRCGAAAAGAAAAAAYACQDLRMGKYSRRPAIVEATFARPHDHCRAAVVDGRRCDRRGGQARRRDRGRRTSSASRVRS
jgi:hypothetical protein